jgi:hypothetical protein
MSTKLVHSNVIEEGSLVFRVVACRLLHFRRKAHFCLLDISEATMRHIVWLPYKLAKFVIDLLCHVRNRKLSALIAQATSIVAKPPRRSRAACFSLISNHDTGGSRRYRCCSAVLLSDLRLRRWWKPYATVNQDIKKTSSGTNMSPSELDCQLCKELPKSHSHVATTISILQPWTLTPLLLRFNSRRR